MSQKQENKEGEPQTPLDYLDESTKNYFLNLDSQEQANVIEMGIRAKQAHDLLNTQHTKDDMISQLALHFNTQLDNKMRELCNFFTSSRKNMASSIIGQIGQEYVEKILKGYKIVDVSDQSHSGDFIVNDYILLEIKDYTSLVPKKEIDKFLLDLETKNMYAGIFISLSSKITGIPKRIEVKYYSISGKKVPAIFVSSSSPELIELMVEYAIWIVNSNNELKDNIKDSFILERINTISESVSGLSMSRNYITEMQISCSKQLTKIYEITLASELRIRDSIEMIKREMTQNNELLIDPQNIMLEFSKKFPINNKLLVSKIASHLDNCWTILTKSAFSKTNKNYKSGFNFLKTKTEFVIELHLDWQSNMIINIEKKQIKIADGYLYIEINDKNMPNIMAMLE